MPIILKQFINNKFVWIAAISVLLYLSGQFQLQETVLNRINKTFNSAIDLGYFNILCWQLLFFAGVLLGTWEVKKHAWWTAFKKNRIILLISILIIIPCFILRHTLYKNIPYADILINRSHLAPLRLLNFMAIAFVVNYLIGRYRPPVFSFLTYLGQNSLQVFSFQVIIVLCMAPYVPLIVKQGYLTELIITTLIVLSLWIPAFLNQLYRKRNKLQFNKNELKAVRTEQQLD